MEIIYTQIIAKIQIKGKHVLNAFFLLAHTILLSYCY